LNPCSPRGASSALLARRCGKPPRYWRRSRVRASTSSSQVPLTFVPRLRPGQLPDRAAR
jgi:hypothetical protein